MVQAPPAVSSGADVTPVSVIAAVLGDAHFAGMHCKGARAGAAEAA